MDLKTFFENFDTLAEAPGGIARLRELILDMAVRGKLVLQDSQDKSTLLYLGKMQEEKEVAEKERGRKAKKRRKADSDKEYKLDFELPENWLLSYLDDICLFIDYRGKTPQKVKSGIRLITAKNVRDSFIKAEPEEFVTEETYEQWMTRGFPEKGDVLFTTEAPLGKAALVNIEERFALAQRVINLHPFSGLDGKFLMWLILSPWFQNELVERATGMTAKGIKASKLKLVQVPLPPLAEQKRIVAKVDELMALCDRAEAAQQTRNTLRQNLRASALDALMNATSNTELETAWEFVREQWVTLCDKAEDLAGLQQSIFQLAIKGKLSKQQKDDGDADIFLKEMALEKNQLIKNKKIRATKKLPVINSAAMPFECPENWTWAYVQDVGEIKLGRQRSPKNHVGPHMVPYLRVANVLEDELDLSDVKEMNFTPEEQNTFRLEYADVLLNEGQSYELVGRPAIYRNEIPGVCFQNTLLRFRAYNRLAPEYALLVFRAYMHSGRFRDKAQQTTNIAHLSAGRLANIEFPLPPLAEQKRIVAKVDELMKQCDRLETTLRKKQQTAEALVASAISHLSA